MMRFRVRIMLNYVDKKVENETEIGMTCWLYRVEG